MAGGYPDTPQQRIAYDLDGTQVISTNAGTGAFNKVLSLSEVGLLNNEHNGTNVITTSVVSGSKNHQWLFPGPYDLFGVWASGDGDEGIENFFINIAVSSDTRSWNTGSWTVVDPGFNVCKLLWDTWRRDIHTFSATEQWGLRGHSAGQGGLEFVGKAVKQVHIYGERSPSQHPDRIIVLDQSTGLELTLFDWGYTPRGVIKTKDLEVKNNSTTTQINSVTLGFNSLNDHNPDVWHELSDGGGAYSSTLDLGDLAPGATYPNTITMRVTVPGIAGMGPWTNRLVVSSSRTKRELTAFNAGGEAEVTATLEAV